MVKEMLSFDCGLASINQCVYDKSNTYIFIASEDSTVKIFNL